MTAPAGVAGPTAARLEAPDTGAAKGKKGDKGRKEKNDDFRKHVPAGWYIDYDQALSQARRTGQPLLVLFH